LLKNKKCGLKARKISEPKENHSNFFIPRLSGFTCLIVNEIGLKVNQLNDCQLLIASGLC